MSPDDPRARGVPTTRICECGHDQGRHDCMTNACLVRGCACTHCETTPDLRTAAGREQARLRAEQYAALPPPIPFPLTVPSHDPNELPATDCPPCRYCPAPSTFLLIAYRQTGWPTTPLCNDCLCNFVRRALASTPHHVDVQ